MPYFLGRVRGAIRWGHFTKILKHKTVAQLSRNSATAALIAKMPTLVHRVGARLERELENCWI